MLFNHIGRPGAVNPGRKDKNMEDLEYRAYLLEEYNIAKAKGVEDSMMDLALSLYEIYGTIVD